jgi:hypothetical protein
MRTTTHDLSLRAAFSYGWRAVQRNGGRYAVAGAVLVGSNLAFSVVERLLDGPAAVAAQVASLAVGAFLAIGMCRMVLDDVDRRDPELGALAGGGHGLFLPNLVATLLFTAAVLVGLALFVLPSLYVAARFGFFGFVLVDRRCGPIAALRGSWELTARDWPRLCMFGALVIAANLAGVMALLVGVVWTLPWTTVASAHLYRQLAGRQRVVVG